MHEPFDIVRSKAELGRALSITGPYVFRRRIPIASGLAETFEAASVKGW
jgi:hypothetical protein